MTKGDLIKAFADKLEPEDLDEFVHAAKSEEATWINNTGIEEQISCLVSFYGLAAATNLLTQALEKEGS